MRAVTGRNPHASLTILPVGHRGRRDPALKLRQSIARWLLRLRGNARAERFVAQSFQRWYDLPAAPTHFHSPLPDIRTLTAHMSRWYRESDLPGIKLHDSAQLALLKELEKYSAEFQKLPDFELASTDGYWPGYGEVEAQLLHAMLRHIQPSRLVEVGSGVSTFYALHALRTNLAEAGRDFTLHCIEPHPLPKLRELTRSSRVSLHEREVQDMPLSFWSALSRGDVLLIDSSHVSKVDSDVNYLFLEVLPRLREGVVTRVRDIPFPYPTVAPQHPVFALSLLWNETALVRALLTHSTAFEILMSQSWLHHKHPDALARVSTAYDPRRHHPTSLWLRKMT
jgi:hypothetical protein